MDIWQSIEVSDVASRIAIAAACAIAGLVLIWLDRNGETTKRRHGTGAKIAPVVIRVVPSTRPSLPRLTNEGAYDRLRACIWEAGKRTQNMNSCQQSAARHLDSAEVALRRLIDEISGVMPVTVSSAFLPRRSMPVMAAPAERALAAA